MDKYISATQLAEIVRRLREQGVRADDPQLEVRIQTALQLALGGSTGQRASQIRIDFPDLEEAVQADIVKSNIEAMAGIYAAAQLEDLKFFQVANLVSQQFMQGLVPVGRSQDTEAVFNFLKRPHERFTEHERRGIYARAFGFAQGAVDEPLPNRQFQDLWMRFLSAIRIYGREQDATIRKSVVAETIHKNGRDLAVNLSLHGYGIAHFAAVEMQETIRYLLKMLGSKEILQAYGVLDVWQLVERVSGLYLGGAVNSVRQRTLSRAGYEIVMWIAQKHNVFADPYGTLVDLDQEIALVNYVERWLAVTGADNQSVDRYSESVSVEQQPLIPHLSLNTQADPLSGINGGGQSLDALMNQAAGNMNLVN